ncbi:hypothetical protein FRC03_005073 [Tulasnella sp. 419]|nr:hypothetical protein FRC03_005073 [Tulasnella sp. 419]
MSEEHSSSVQSNKNKKRRRNDSTFIKRSLFDTVVDGKTVQPNNKRRQRIQNQKKSKILRDIKPKSTQEVLRELAHIHQGTSAPPLPTATPSFRWSDILDRRDEEPNGTAFAEDPDRNIIRKDADPQVFHQIASRAEEIGDQYEPIDPDQVIDVDLRDFLPTKEANALRSVYLPHLFSQEYLPEPGFQICQSQECQTVRPFSKLWRCRDCFDPQIYCDSCLVLLHQHQPFHHVDSWTLWDDGFFKRDTLCNADLTVQLGHNDCPEPTQPSILDVMDVNGVFSLFNYGIFPSTEQRPSTGYTLRVLEHFQLFHIITKVSPMHYVQSIEYLTDALSRDTVKNLYNNFLKVQRQWRVLQMMKRAGRMDTSHLQPGELTVKCAACPRPDYNLPENWEADPMAPLLYALFVSGDGNRSLQQRKGRPGKDVDPSFVGDFGYWANQEQFNRYTAAAAAGHASSRKNPPSCNTHTRATEASELASKLDVGGIFAVTCRHVLFQPNAVIDFKKGEKYA